MKLRKITWVLAASLLLSQLALAQFDDVKNMVLLNQYKQANEKLKELMSKPKNAAKPEGFMLQATIWSALMTDSSMAAQAKDLRKQAIESYNKYLQMDPKKELISVPPYPNAPINLYSSFFNDGIKDYNKKDWPSACESFKNTVYWSDFIIENKLAKMEFDTSANLLAGAAFQNDKNDTMAIKYFSRLTDRKIGGADNEFIYQFMMGYYFKVNDAANFDKYKKLGTELYPKSEYFGYSWLDFIMAMDDETEKMKRIEAEIAKNPNDIELIENYGLMLFDKLNGPDDAAKPANYDEMEQKMITNLTKAGEAKPTSGKPYYYLGNHYVNKAVKVNDQINAVTDEIKKANANAKPDKNGKLPPPPKELSDKREQLKKTYNDEVDKGVPYLLKSAEAYGKVTDLKGIEMQNYKRLVDQLILIYGDKKASTKDPKQKAQFETEEKKWTDVYSKISH